MGVLRSQCEHGTLIVVTHDLEILQDADIVFRMRDGNLTETIRDFRANLQSEISTSSAGFQK
jgi:ABC-type lipoprotein export system ATPase subunit